MEQVMSAGWLANLSPTATGYNSLTGGESWNATEFFPSRVVSTGGKIKNLRVKLNGTPGAGKEYAFTLMVEGSPTALTLTISDAETKDADTVNEVAVSAGQSVSSRCVPSGTPTARKATWTSMFESTTANESLILGGSGTALDNTSIEYGQVMSSRILLSATENNFRQVIPTAGTIKNLYIKLNLDPGTSPDAYRFTLRLANSGNSYTLTDTALTVTITANDTTGNDTANDVTVAAGDFITMKIEPLNTPSAIPSVIWGMTFVADTDGESIIIGGSLDDLHNTTTEYNSLTGAAYFVWQADETLRYQLGQVCTLKKLYVLLSAVPDTGKKYTFTARIAGASSNVVVEIADTATTGNSSALSDTVADDEYVNLMVVPTSTPDVADAYWGLVSFIAPPVAQAVGGGAVTIAGTLGLLTKLSVGAGSIASAGTLGRLIKLSVGAGSVTISGALSSVLTFLQAVGSGAIAISGTLTSVRTIFQAVGDGAVAITGALAFTLDRILKIASILKSDLTIKSVLGISIAPGFPYTFPITFRDEALSIVSILKTDLKIKSTLTEDLTIESTLSTDLTTKSTLLGG